MSQRAGKLLPKQHPFEVGQEVQSVEVIIAVGDDVTNENIQEKVASITDGNWKILTTDVGFGFWWDGSKFISPQPHASWSLNSEGTAWEAPIAQPANSTFTVSHVDDNGESYDTTVDTYFMTWNETDQRWEGFNRQDNKNYYWDTANSSWTLIS
jgi:hypothetical protein